MALTQETKTKIKKGGTLGLGMGAAGFLGLAQGSGIDHVFDDKILEAIREGDMVKLGAYVLIFLAIWLEVRGLKKAVGDLSSNINSPDGIIAKSFAKGEERFNTIESQQLQIEHRLTVLEQRTHGGKYGQGDCVT